MTHVLSDVTGAILASVNGERLVGLASDLVDIPSATGDELEIATYLQRTFEDMGLQVTWQEVEEGRANIVGLLEGTGEGKSLMLNGHMDTSYSGREPFLRGVGFKPKAVLRDGRIYGLGVWNMKGSLACYTEAVRALQDAGVRLRGDVVVACVAGEIEKTQWGDEFRGKQYRGYGVGTQHLVTHGVVADMCIVGEPTGQRIVLAHHGAIWMRISTTGPFMHTAFSEGRLHENSILRMTEVIEAVKDWTATWGELTSRHGGKGLVNVGAIRGGFPWRASRTPGRTDLFLDLRVPPEMPITEAAHALRALVRSLRERYPSHGIDSETYVSVPGAQISEEHELVRAIEASHETVLGESAEKESGQWFSDASVLTRYGIQTVNYGPSSGPPGEEGEYMAVGQLTDMARIYALTAARICGVAS